MQDEERTWEQLGFPRRDCEPHRGGLLLLMGNASMVCGTLSLCVIIPALVGLPLAIAVIVMAKNDLARMNDGLLDPSGREQAVMASVRATFGALLCLLCWISGSIVYFLVDLLRTFGPW